jgi:hypothetical protein
MRMVMSPHSSWLSPGAARTPCNRLHTAPRLCMIRSYISKTEIEGGYSYASTCVSVQRWQPTHYLAGHITGRADDAQHVRWQVHNVHACMCISDEGLISNTYCCTQAQCPALVQMANVMHASLIGAHP